jgi:hypothetical protein
MERTILKCLIDKEDSLVSMLILEQDEGFTRWLHESGGIANISSSCYPAFEGETIYLRGSEPEKDYIIICSFNNYWDKTRIIEHLKSAIHTYYSFCKSKENILSFEFEENAKVITFSFK